MLKHRLSLLTSLALLLGVAIILLAIFAAASNNHPATAHGTGATQVKTATPQTPTLPYPTTKGDPVQGTSAITPHLHGIPAFTAADVQKFVATYGFAGGQRVDGGPTVILLLKLVTIKQANAIIHNIIGNPDNELVYVVELQGPFPPGDPYTPAGPSAKIGVEVFDARTGNMLLWSA